MEFLHSFLRGTSGGVLKCRLFFQAITRRCTMLNLSVHRINVLLSVHSHWLCVTLDVIVILSHAKSIKWRTLGLVPLQRRTFNTTFYNPSHKLETLVWFSPSQCWFGFVVISVLQNTLGTTLGKERGTFEWEQRCEEWMLEVWKKFKTNGSCFNDLWRVL